MRRTPESTITNATLCSTGCDGKTLGCLQAKFAKMQAAGIGLTENQTTLALPVVLWQDNYIELVDDMDPADDFHIIAIRVQDDVASMIKSTATALSSLLAVALANAATAQVYTPKPGSAERTAILKVLHDGDTRPEARFIIHIFRVVRDGSRSIAYVDGEGEVGGFHAILTQQVPAPWRKVWGESDGGSDTCAAGALHYAWAVRLIQSYKVGPDALFPGVVRQAQDLKRSAAADPDLQCVGDLDGGPGK